MLKTIWELLKIIIVCVLIILPIRYFVVQPFYVKGASMEPTFHDHEYLLIDEISYRFAEPKRGDVVVFRYPDNPQEYFIKRVIALPGEKVEIKDGKVFIYNTQFPEGFALDESLYLDEKVSTYDMSEEIVTLRQAEYYVLGDNRNSSKDSRTFGPVQKSFLTGRVLLRGWPVKSATFFPSLEYKY